MLGQDFSFAQRIKLENIGSIGTVEDIKHKVKQLREDYCFPVVGCYEDMEHFRIIVVISEDCSDIKKGWIREVVKYYLPVGIVLEIGTHFGKDKILLESQVRDLLIRGELTFE